MNIFNKLFKVLTDSTEEWVSRQEVTTNGRGYVNYICKRPNDLKSIEDYMKRYVAFDVETTGLDSKKDRIIEYIKLDRDKSTFKSHRNFSSEKEISFKHF